MAETTDVSGMRKAAIFVLTLEQGIAAEILKHLDETQIEDLSREIAGLGPVTQGMRDEVVGSSISLPWRGIMPMRAVGIMPSRS